MGCGTGGVGWGGVGLGIRLKLRIAQRRLSQSILSLVFDIPMIRILALYLDFEGAKNIHVLQVLIWGFGGCWRFLTGVWHLDLDMEMVIHL